jgi:hypothetical protein
MLGFGSTVAHSNLAEKAGNLLEQLAAKVEPVDLSEEVDAPDLHPMAVEEVVMITHTDRDLFEGARNLSELPSWAVEVVDLKKKIDGKHFISCGDGIPPSQRDLFQEGEKIN